MNIFAMGDKIPPIDSAEALRKIDAAKKKARKAPKEKLEAHLRYCKDYVKRNSKNGFAYLMIDARLVWFCQLHIEAISQVLNEIKGE